MAYKFQLGAAKLGGKVTAAGLDAGDADIDNVGKIEIDEIAADNNDIKMIATHNRGQAFQISGSQGVLAFADTTNNQYRMYLPKGLGLDVDGDVVASATSGRFGLYASGALGAGGMAMELASGLNESFQPLRLSASCALQFVDNNFKMDKNGNDLRIATQGSVVAKFNSTGLELEGAMDCDTVVIANPSSLAGAALVRNAGTLDVGVDDSSIEINSDALRIKDNGVTLAKMAGIARGSIIVGDASGDPSALAKGTAGQFAISDGDDIIYRSLSGDATLSAAGALTIAANAVEGSMLNSNVAGTGLTYAGNNIDVEAAQTAITSVLNSSLVIGEDAQTKVDFGTSNVVKVFADNAERLTVAAASTTVSNNLIVAGDLTVQGAAVEIQQGFVVTSSVKFEGSTPDGNETELIATNPTADRTITLPDLSGHIPLLAGAIGSANVTAAEFALLDGGSTVQTRTGGAALVDADGFLCNNGGTMEHVRLLDLKTYIGSGLSAVAAKADGDTLIVGVNYMADMGSNGEDTLTLPASPAIGESVKVKAPSDCSSDRYITIAKAGSQTIDGANDIKLESPFAAVELVYVAANLWRVF